MVSPRRLGTFSRSPKVADGPTAPTVPVDEASGPFGSDSLAFDSPAQSPSARPKKPRPPVSFNRANGTELRKSPLGEEVTSEAGHGEPVAAAAVNISPTRAIPSTSSPSMQRHVHQSVHHTGTNGITGKRPAIASQAKANSATAAPPQAKANSATAAPPQAKANSATAVPPQVKANSATAAPPQAKANSATAAPTALPKPEPVPSSVGPSDSFVSATEIPSTVNGSAAASDAQASNTDASQKDLFGGNRAAGNSNATTPRFANSATAFSSGAPDVQADTGAASTNGVSSAPEQQQVGYSVPPPQQSSPTKAVPVAALVAAIPSSSASSQPSGKQPTTMAGSAPDSPKTPRDGRDILTVESCQLNTGSSVQPQPAVPPHSEGRLRSPVGRPTSGPVMSYPGPAALSPPASASVPYAAAYQGVTPPSSAPSFMVGRQAPSSVNVQGSPMRSPRATARPRTPTGPLPRRGVTSSYPPPEALEELGSTFLKYPGVLPHFMRPTAAHEHRLKAEPEDSRSASPPARRPRSVAPNAHFIQPTASYVAKVAPSESSTPKRALSACVVWSPQLQLHCMVYCCDSNVCAGLCLCHPMCAIVTV